MSESDETFRKMGVEAAALQKEIVNRAREIADALITGCYQEVDGVRVHKSIVILNEAKKKVEEELYG